MFFAQSELGKVIASKKTWASQVYITLKPYQSSTAILCLWESGKPWWRKAKHLSILLFAKVVYVRNACSVNKQLQHWGHLEQTSLSQEQQARTKTNIGSPSGKTWRELPLPPLFQYSIDVVHLHSIEKETCIQKANRKILKEVIFQTNPTGSGRDQSQTRVW